MRSSFDLVFGEESRDAVVAAFRANGLRHQAQHIGRAVGEEQRARRRSRWCSRSTGCRAPWRARTAAWSR